MVRTKRPPRIAPESSAGLQATFESNYRDEAAKQELPATSDNVSYVRLNMRFYSQKRGFRFEPISTHVAVEKLVSTAIWVRTRAFFIRDLCSSPFP
jgi:hypothetical protein